MKTTFLIIYFWVFGAVILAFPNFMKTKNFPKCFGDTKVERVIQICGLLLWPIVITTGLAVWLFGYFKRMVESRA